MKELTDKERSEIQEAEEARSVNLMFVSLSTCTINCIGLHMNCIGFS